MSVAEPHKELRFTRAAQAVPFWIGAAVMGCAGLVLIAISFYRDVNPSLPHPAWAVLPILAGWVLARVALHCTRRAYIILSPLGVEIFPLIRPAKGMQMIPWGQIKEVETGEHIVTLHFDPGRSGGIHLSLAPIPKARRHLLKEALTGRMKSIRQSAPEQPQS